MPTRVARTGGDQVVEQRPGRPAEPLRPGAVAPAELLEEDLLERVPGEQRQPELGGQRTRDCRLARSRRSCDDDEERTAQIVLTRSLSASQRASAVSPTSRPRA